MSNFKCDKCGMINVDCGLGVFKTPREIELEARVKELEEENKLLANVSKKVEQKLQIAEEALDYYAELYIDTDVCDDQFFGADAVEALQKMKDI